MRWIEFHTRDEGKTEAVEEATLQRLHRPHVFIQTNLFLIGLNLSG